ncbi:MAG TPA: isochorismate synthase, partial [Spirillospora sp.]|nr:isochorismate synthase [Spirillospora sp.]
YADCYRFLFEPRPYHAFYGATPELLAQVEGRRLRTMALAGSIRRGLTPADDAAYAEQILHDPKERHEHALVADALRERLRAVTDELRMPNTPGILRLSNIQHLHTPVEGVLKAEMGVLPVVERLHPTPALGGQPRDLALDFIRKAEPVPRGWYAAPIGWIDSNLDGIFGVAIRSAVSQDKRVWLYAGAGIVADSVPQKEWDETALKFRPMLGALGIGDMSLVK